MPNSNPQAVRVANEKIRVAADRLGQFYNLSKALSAEGTAEGWLTLFPNDVEVMVDGSATDGRTPITNADVRDIITMIQDLITWAEAASNARRNLMLKVAVNPERF
jgi:hypothetical protein